MIINIKYNNKYSINNYELIIMIMIILS